MKNDLSLIEVKKQFRYKVERRLAKHGRRTALVNEINISRAALWRFLEKGTVRKNTLNEIVRYFDGENADVEKYIIKP